jgi:hypothetical protein
MDIHLTCRMLRFQLALAVAGAQFDGAIGFGRGTIGEPLL